jgi:hypothetical protein
VAAWADVRRLALAMPEVSEGPTHGDPAWKVRDKLFAWDRPLRKTDLADLAARSEIAPAGPILGVRVAHLEAKEALLAENPDVYFTIPHFDGYLAVLIRLDEIAVEDLEDVLIEAWLCRAPKRLAAEYLKGGK